jgi:hypothetical protein
LSANLVYYITHFDLLPKTNILNIGTKNDALNNQGDYQSDFLTTPPSKNYCAHATFGSKQPKNGRNAICSHFTNWLAMIGAKR